MYNSRKRQLEELPQQLTAIWSCPNEKCNGWMRDNFAFATLPKCVQCGSPMEKGEKMLPIVANASLHQMKR